MLSATDYTALFWAFLIPKTLRPQDKHNNIDNKDSVCKNISWNCV